MKKINLNLLLVLTFFMLGSVSGNRNNSGNVMPVTSTSGKAIELYYKSIKAMENAENKQAILLLDKALKQDSCFFMAFFQQIMYDLYQDKEQELKIHIENALNSNIKLSAGEQILKKALNSYQMNPKNQLSGAAKKLTEMYPADIDIWYILASLQAMEKNYKESLISFQKIIEKSDNPGPFYNQVGYLNMFLENYGAAERAFNKYIKLNPNHPNPYDSKGDFYMHTEKYPQAYCNYMIAYALNRDWSYDKAMRAKWKSIARKY